MSGEWSRLLLDAVEKAVSESFETGASVAFSGGIDSSLIAHLARRTGNVELICTGLEGSKDMAAARVGAVLLGMPLVEVVVGEEEARREARKLSGLLGLTDPQVLSWELPLYFAARAARYGTILTGQGADEQFGGYARYLRIAAQGPEALGAALESDTSRLLSSGINTDHKTATAAGKTLRTPYTHPAVVEVASKIPPEFKVRDGVRKWILREAGRTAGLPVAICDRPKRACQYGSGFLRAIRRERVPG